MSNNVFQQIKILACHNRYLQTGGEDLSFDDEVELLRTRGHEVIVYERNNQELQELGTARMLSKLFWNREAYNDVKQLIEKHRPDVMHCTNTFPLMSVAVYDAAKEYDVPVVQALRNYRVFCANSVCVLNGKPCDKCLGKRFAYPAALNRCYRNSWLASTAVASLQAYLRTANPWKDKVHVMYTLSKFARAKLVEAGIPADKIYVKPNFVIDPMEPVVASTKPRDYAVFAGRLSHEKGIATLMAAWEKLESPLKLVVLGDGPLGEVVRKAAEKDERIIWKGRRERDEVLKTIGESRFLIIPSISFETFGRTIIEAYSMNTPVIGSDDGAIAENIVNGKTGLTFQTGNADDLAAKVIQLSADESLLRAMRVAAGQRYQEFYTEEENYRLLIGLYQIAMGIHEVGDPEAFDGFRGVAEAPTKPAFEQKITGPSPNVQPDIQPGT